jgi:hypothetical protein
MGKRRQALALESCQSVCLRTAERAVRVCASARQECVLAHGSECQNVTPAS